MRRSFFIGKSRVASANCLFFVKFSTGTKVSLMLYYGLKLNERRLINECFG